MNTGTRNLVLIVVIAVLAASAAFAVTQVTSQITSTSQTSSSTSATTSILKNGTTYEEAAFQTRRAFPNGSVEAIANGTTVSFDNISFTYIVKNWNCSCEMNLFKVGPVDGHWSEMLQISQPVATGETNTVYTNHTNPSVGLSLRHNSTVVYFLVSIQQGTPPAAGCVQSTSSASTLMSTVYYVNSTRATLCVMYKFIGAGVANFTSPRVQPWYQNSNEMGNASCSAASCEVPTVTASPAVVNHSAGALVTVTYTIQAPANMTGLFIVFHVGCDPVYLAYGTLPSTVYLTAWTCGPSNALTGGYRSANYSVTGITNTETAFLPWT